MLVGDKYTTSLLVWNWGYLKRSSLAYICSHWLLSVHFYCGKEMEDASNRPCFHVYISNEAAMTMCILWHVERNLRPSNKRTWEIKRGKRLDWGKNVCDWWRLCISPPPPKSTGLPWVLLRVLWLSLQKETCQVLFFSWTFRWHFNGFFFFVCLFFIGLITWMLTVMLKCEFMVDGS